MSPDAIWRPIMGADSRYGGVSGHGNNNNNLPSRASTSRCSSDGDAGGCASGSMGSAVEGVAVGVDASDLDGPLGVRVEQRRLPRPGSLRRRAPRRRWRCTHCLRSAMAALQSATNPTSNEVDDAWFHL